MALKTDLAQVTDSPKSTIVGLCILALAAEHGVHFDAAGHVSMTARDWFEVLCGALTAVVSGLSHDAGRVKARVPGTPEPQMVPSHEKPDQPEAVPLVEGSANAS